MGEEEDPELNRKATINIQTSPTLPPSLTTRQRLEGHYSHAGGLSDHEPRTQDVVDTVFGLEVMEEREFD